MDILPPQSTNSYLEVRYRSGAAPCKNDQKMIIFDFETLFLGQKIELGVTKSTIRFALLLRVEMYWVIFLIGAELIKRNSIEKQVA